MHRFSSINVNKEILQFAQLCAYRPKIEFIFYSSPTTGGSPFSWGGAECVLRHFSINWGFQKEVLLDYGIKNPFYIKQFLSSLVF
jgi:hypothetical protein